jgi:hypothetical protein
MDPNKVFCHNPDCPARGKVQLVMTESYISANRNQKEENYALRITDCSGNGCLLAVAE